jgi:hypothetical protein
VSQQGRHLGDSPTKRRGSREKGSNNTIWLDVRCMTRV